MNNPYQEQIKQYVDLVQQNRKIFIKKVYKVYTLEFLKKSNNSHICPLSLKHLILF